MNKGIAVGGDLPVIDFDFLVYNYFGRASQVTYRLTYEDVEDMLANGIARTSEESQLGRLDELAQLRYRLDTGLSSAPRLPILQHKQDIFAFNCRTLKNTTAMVSEVPFKTQAAAEEKNHLREGGNHPGEGTTNPWEGKAIPGV